MERKAVDCSARWRLPASRGSRLILSRSCSNSVTWFASQRGLKHAYFPQGIVLSLLTVLENGSAIETANIGCEGAFGLFAATIKVERTERIAVIKFARGAGRPSRPPSHFDLVGAKAVHGAAD
jgi:hypothetical protein